VSFPFTQNPCKESFSPGDRAIGPEKTVRRASVFLVPNRFRKYPESSPLAFVICRGLQRCNVYAGLGT
jgi:hypothetical protein